MAVDLILYVTVAELLKNMEQSSTETRGRLDGLAAPGSSP
jgi:hypothetical protein